ncbi:hypothetical protein [Flavobacterium sp. '19STA2R22 D10 B1']|uniref:hypothetical protein n=1 Tax=Flavobacterium aerium TaxID=3037261 RepID=UPI00278C3D39|nr:hypothetical protein [Flavobacterium sp. '19STA2R22 D10 B1']
MYKSTTSIDSINKHLQTNIYEGIYKDILGKTRSSIQVYRYFILSALSLEQKLYAIKAIAEAMKFKGNDYLKDFDSFPKIYLPNTVIKKQ